MGKNDGMKEKVAAVLELGDEIRKNGGNTDAVAVRLTLPTLTVPEEALVIWGEVVALIEEAMAYGFEEENILVALLALVMAAYDDEPVEAVDILSTFRQDLITLQDTLT